MDSEQIRFPENSDIHRRAIDALRRQEDRDAIARGIAEMEAGESISIEEARKLTLERLQARLIK